MGGLIYCAGWTGGTGGSYRLSALGQPKTEILICCSSNTLRSLDTRGSCVKSVGILQWVENTYLTGLMGQRCLDFLDFLEYPDRLEGVHVLLVMARTALL